MRTAFFSVFILLANAVAPSSGIAQDPREAIIQRGIKATARGHYEAALKDFQKIVDRAPGEPEGYFFLASVYNVLTGHFELPSYRNGFEKNVRKALSLSEQRIQKSPEDAKAYMIAGLTMGMLGLDSVRQKSYIRAFFRSRKTTKYLEKAIELDPGMEDAYYALGLYYFWRVRAKWFRFLAPLLGDTGEKGLRYIRRTAERGKWLRDLARIELVYALYVEKRFGEARRLAGALIAQYPEQPHYRFAFAEGYFSEKKYKRAKSEFRRLSDRLKQRSDKISRLYADFAEWRIVRADFALGNFQEAERRALKFRDKPDMGSPLLKDVRKAAERLIADMNGKEFSSVERISPPRRHD